MSSRARRRIRAFAARATATTAAALAALVLAGCAILPAAPPPAVPVDGVECPSTVTPGRAPDGFEPVAAYSCDGLGGFEDAEGRWSATTVQRLEGDLSELVAAFGEPSDPRWPGPCTAIGIVVPDVWLVDATGAAIRLAYPSNGCGQPKTERIMSALADLDVVDEEHRDARLQESRAAIEAGCATRGEVLRLMTAPELETPRRADPDPGSLDPDGPGSGADGIVTIPASPLPDATQVEGMRVCRYDTDLALPEPGGLAGFPEAGIFTSPPRLSPPDALAALAEAEETDGEAADAGTAIECDRTAERYALLHLLDASGQPLGLPIAVELDGCERMSAAGPATPASPELLALLRD